MVSKKRHTAIYPYRKHTRKSGHKRRVLLFGLLGTILVVCIAAFIALLILYSDVNFEYFVELGSPIPAADVFAKSGEAEYTTDVSAIDASVIGGHWVHVSAGGKDRLVRLVIRDTVAPQAQPVELDISVNDKVTPDQLVSGLEDAGAVKLEWNKPPDFGTVGDYSVVIKMQDLGGNTSSVTSLVHIRAVVSTLTYEMGTELPALQDFLAGDLPDAKFLTDLSTLPLDKPGEYDVSIEVNGSAYTSKLVVADTVAPEITVQTVCIKPGESAAPKDFIAAASDASELNIEFTTEPDYQKIGNQDVTIAVTDLGGNQVQQNAVLLISNVKPITVEIRNAPLTEQDFAGVSQYESMSLVTEMVPDQLGVYNVELKLDGQTNPSIVTVVDTTPPEAQAVEVEWYLSHPASPEKFVTDVSDYTDITYSFVNEPDWESPDSQRVSVELTDAAGNTSKFTSSLTLVPDTKAPSLYGVKDRYCYIGQAVAYFAAVFAEDNCDAEVTLDVDKSNVDINKEGTYEVTYKATDSSGNATQESCEFTFIEESVTDEELNAAADKVIADITTADMPIGRQAYAVFKYVNTHVKYTGTSNKTDWKYEAYRGITKGRGDCFTFYATAKCLLEKIGAQTMCVERYGGSNPNHHYWLLVNIGRGWYHFDAINCGPRNFECFMKTDKELLARGPNWWSFNRDIFPPTPKESFKLEEE